MGAYKETLRQCLFGFSSVVFRAGKQAKTRGLTRARPVKTRTRLGLFQNKPGSGWRNVGLKLPFQRLVREIAQDFKTDLRFQSHAVWHCKKQLKPTWLVCLRTLTCVPSTQSVSLSCPRIFNLLGGSEEKGLDQPVLMMVSGRRMCLVYGCTAAVEIEKPGILYLGGRGSASLLCSGLKFEPLFLNIILFVK
ncbi:hypothetical protein C5167_033505 [Papaver somniferum]|uniref:Uncharacterized protein n=1 Tax=Papaver somniferum TaxID=3469 RepID=A0A4Y7KEA9_PAPSO|nr:hypothetical protein C5167_033505 [Papaver somniferum]